MKTRYASTSTIAPPAREHRRTTRERGGGRPLDPGVRAGLEPRFGHHFDAVRIHDDASADAIARQRHASALTVGSDIYFAGGAADLTSLTGAHRLAHELAHVVQFDRAGAAGDAADSLDPSAIPAATRHDEAAEREARDAATTIVLGGAPQPIGATPSAPVAREEEERGFDAKLLPPSLSYGYGAGGGSGNFSLGLGGLGAEWQRGLFHTEAGLGFGGDTELNLGLGAPLRPWMMDLNRDLGDAAGGVNSLMNGGGVNLGALGGFGALGGVATAGEPSRYPWGVGLQLSHSDEETRAMLGLRLDL
jgi:hypothetical protein